MQMAPYYVFRTHTIPCLPRIDYLVLGLYASEFKKNGVLMTSLEMRNLILGIWRREDTWEEYGMIIKVPTLEDQMNAVNSDSMDQYWLDIKPRQVDFSVIGRLTFKKTPCPICMEDTGHKIMLHHCSCIFHKKCIERSVKYSDVCPVCETTIYKQEIHI